MCETCTHYRQQARIEARRVEDLAGRLEAAKATLATWRGAWADHAARHPYREEVLT